MSALQFLLELTGCVLLAFVFIFLASLALLTIIKTIQIIKNGDRSDGK